MAEIEHPAAYGAAVKRYILGNAKKTWMNGTPRAEEILDALEAGRIYGERGTVEYADGFIGSLARAFDTFGKLSPNQAAAVLRGIDARAARRAEWASKQAAIDASREWVGEVGGKINIELTLRHFVEIPGFRGVSYIFICEDAAQNTIVYKGTAAVFIHTKVGDRVRVAAKVREHGVRNGVKQTVIERPKAA